MSAIASSVHAQEFEAPAWLGEMNTEYAEWLNFTTALGSNTPDVEGSTGDSALSQTIPGAIITGTMNIYNPAGASQFEINDSVDSLYQTVVLQTLSSGTELDYASLVLEYETLSSTQSIAATREELYRVTGGFGDDVISRWTWDLTHEDVCAFTIRVNSLGAHTSLVSARLDTQSLPSQIVELSKNSPDLDRWNYPFNATPGTRTAAPVFRSATEEGIERYGDFIIGFDAEATVNAGQNPDAYIIESARLVVTTTSNFEVAYDPTRDSVFTYLPEDHEAYVADEGAGRPVELFGTGFRNGFDPLTWEEDSLFSLEEGERSVFPASLDQSGMIVDVTDAVNFAEPVETYPFATGTFESTTPGDLVPHETAMTFDLNVSNPTVQTYLKQSLSTGRVFFTITCLSEGIQGATARTYLEFATRENLLSDPPMLEMTVRLVEVPFLLEITELGFDSEGKATLSFAVKEGISYQIRYTSDFITWQTIENPTLTFPSPGVVQWTDETPSAGAKFYQIVVMEQVIDQVDSAR